MHIAKTLFLIVESVISEIGTKIKSEKRYNLILGYIEIKCLDPLRAKQTFIRKKMDQTV